MKRLMSFIGVILFLNSSAQLNFIYQINGGIVTFSINPPHYYESVKWVFGDGTYASSYNLQSVTHSYAMNANYTVCVIGYPMPIANIDTTCKTISLTTVGIKESKLNELPIDLYPNPVKDKLNVELEENKIGKISITNCLGQIVYVLNNPVSKQEIDLSSFPTGVYYLKAESKSDQKVFKILKD
ncbi:MAG TPA: T9SS type A sorting domain-containing protein [Bacteroidia bacterium]|jgi:hypothetical protein|nr:T9SS type A sorting domain-containing protein [Bacteroidia bacterium]